MPQHLMAFLDNAPRYLFFTGKGGVGKTSLASASAVYLSDAGQRVLIVSTDPASNLDAVFRTSIRSEPTPVPGAPGVQALNIDPEQAAHDYRERTVAPYRGQLQAEEIALLEERLSGACTVEVAAFDEFALLLGEDERTAHYDHVIFDTAPTGHTLRLLRLPAAWTGFLESAPGDVSCLGPLSGLKARRECYERTVRALADPSLTAVVLVARPDHVALLEAERTSTDLQGQGMTNQRLVINGVFVASDRHDPLALALERRGLRALADLPPRLAALPRSTIPLRPANMVGLAALRTLLADGVTAHPAGTTAGPMALSQGLTGLRELVDELTGRDHGLVTVMGKGGVGKTTVAAAVAVALAGAGKAVHLTSTDPAQHLAEMLPEQVPNLRVSYIDPKAEVASYRARTLAAARRTKPPDQVALLEEELQSPCYEELAVFQAFSRVLIGGRKEYVVIDTAPTGHTLLLIDTAGAYHREIVEHTPAGVHVRTPLMLLQDRDFTRVLIVALPEMTPVLEAASLQRDLRRAGIEPYAWVINASLAAAAPRDPVLRARAALELEQIETVKREMANRVVLVPFQAEEPVGAERLRALVG